MPQRDFFQFATRFWDRVDRRNPTECWPWTGPRSKRGYGNTAWRNPETGEQRHLIAHRVAYHLTHGAPPAGLVVMHTCDSPPCCNPVHLRVGTIADNNADRALKGRSSHHAPPPGSFRLRGSEHPMAKLTEEQANDIKALCNEGRLPQREIAYLFGVSQRTVTLINIGKHWTQRSLH